MSPPRPTIVKIFQNIKPDGYFYSKMLNEHDVLSKVKHKNIIKLYDGTEFRIPTGKVKKPKGQVLDSDDDESEEEETFIYQGELILEYCQGGKLYDYLQALPQWLSRLGHLSW